MWLAVNAIPLAVRVAFSLFCWNIHLNLLDGNPN